MERSIAASAACSWRMMRMVAWVMNGSCACPAQA
jgi:hypothetical protein